MERKRVEKKKKRRRKKEEEKEKKKKKIQVWNSCLDILYDLLVRKLS